LKNSFPEKFAEMKSRWKTARRVVAKVEFHFGELLPRVGFIVTNLETDSRAVVRFYNKRGTAEQWIKEGKQAVKMTRLSCHRFRSNQVRLALSLLAYNLGNLWRRLALPKKIENWSLTSLQQRLVKTGGRLVKHAVLLAAPGGRASEPAAVRSHAGPDRAAPGTDGIDNGGQVSNGIWLQRGWGKERCCKSGLESGTISGCAGADGRPSGVLPMKIVSQCREQARRVYYGAVFEIKKEIRAERGCHGKA
jgi:Transposase DDE domain group 1